MAKPALKSVPVRACPRILWSIGLGAGRFKGSPAFIKLLLTLCALIRRLQPVPVQWSEGQAATLPKNHGKPLSIRLVHMFDDVGKASHSHLWHQGEHRYDSHSFGLVPGRRRISSISIFYDVANAFPSLARDSLDTVVNNYFPVRYWPFLLDRNHKNLLMLPITADSWLCVRPTVGDAPGDVSAPQKFITALDATTYGTCHP
eukprot:11594624-Heterocapsa_arctica.AAC.1